MKFTEAKVNRDLSTENRFRYINGLISDAVRKGRYSLEVEDVLQDDVLEALKEADYETTYYDGSFLSNGQRSYTRISW